MKRLGCIAFVLSGLIAFGSVCEGAITLEFSPSSQTVNVGTQVSVELFISGLGDFAAPSIGAFDVDVSFAPAILRFSSVTFASFLGDPTLDALTSSMVTSPGILDVFEVSLLLPADLITLQPASFSLATLSFATLGAGTSVLNVSVQALGDENGDPLTATTLDGLVTVTPASTVPEPATLLVLLIGLAPLSAAAWRCRR